MAPQHVENLLKGDPFVSQALVEGDRRPYPVALITLNPEELVKLARERGLGDKPPAELVRHPAVMERVQRIVDAVNAHLASYARLKRFAVLPDDFTQDGGELTPTLKVKRRDVPGQVRRPARVPLPGTSAPRWRCWIQLPPGRARRPRHRGQPGPRPGHGPRPRRGRSGRGAVARSRDGPRDETAAAVAAARPARPGAPGRCHGGGDGIQAAVERADRDVRRRRRPREQLGRRHREAARGDDARPSGAASWRRTSRARSTAAAPSAPGMIAPAARQGDERRLGARRARAARDTRPTARRRAGSWP